VDQVLGQRLRLILQLLNLLLLVVLVQMGLPLLNRCRFLLLQIVLVHICKEASPVKLTILRLFRRNYEFLLNVAETHGQLDRDRRAVVREPLWVFVQRSHVKLLNTARQFLSVIKGFLKSLLLFYSNLHNFV